MGFQTIQRLKLLRIPRTKYQIKEKWGVKSSNLNVIISRFLKKSWVLEIIRIDKVTGRTVKYYQLNPTYYDLVYKKNKK